MSRFRLGQGRLEALDDEARRTIGARSDEWEQLVTSPDLFWLVRSPPQGGQAPTPRVVLAGDASGFPLSDLIAFLSQSRWTGAVRVQDGNGVRAIQLKDGEIRGAHSDSPADKLGEVIVRLGYTTREVLDEVLEQHPPSRLGRALIERGVLQSHDLWKCINHQVSEIFHALVLCREGTFTLVDQEPDDKTTTNVQLSLQSLLMDSIRKVDELAHFRKRIPHGRMYVLPRGTSDGRLEAEEDAVLALVDGTRTVQELGSLARLSEFDATRVVFRLLEGKYVQVSQEPLARPPQVQSTPTGRAPANTVREVATAAFAKGSAAAVAQEPANVRPPATESAPLTPARDPRHVVRVFNRIFDEIRGEVEQQDMARELIAAANAALGGKALSTSPVLEDVLFNARGQLSEEELLSRFESVRAELGSEPVASLRHALSEVMFFLLFEAGELLESRQDEALSQRVKALLAPLDEA